MIVYENGRFRSLRPIDERKRLLNEQLKLLPPKQRAALDILVKEGLAKDKTSKSNVANMAEKFEWDPSTGPAVPIRQWINDKYYLGELAETLFPKLKEDMCELFEGDYYECVLTGSTRWGKDYFGTTALIRVIYELYCLKRPGDTLGLGKGEMIHIIPISHQKEAARRIVFEGVQRKLVLSPFWKGRFESTTEEIRFPGKNIIILGGGSNENTAMGFNVWSALVDESNFMGKSRKASIAAGMKEDKSETIYDSLRRRIRGTYGAYGFRGKLFLVSSKKSIHDFTERHLFEVMKDQDPGVFVRDYCTWDVRPNSFPGQKWWKAAVDQHEGRVHILGEYKDEKNSPPHKPDQIWFRFPDEYYKDFLNDPEGAARDIAGIALESFRPFFSNRQAIDDMQKPNRLHPFHVMEWDAGRDIKILWDNLVMKNVHGDPVPRCCPNALRHCHIDLSSKKDATGFCVGHIAGEVEVTRTDPETGERKREEAPFMHIDLVLRIKPPRAGELDHQLVRSLIYKLREGGIPIKSVTADTWMGLPNLQMIEKHGFETDQISTQRTLDPYLAAQSAMYERRIESPVYPHLAKELRELELNDQGTKVDHPKTGSKDCADAFAGVVFYLAKNHRTIGGGTVSRGDSTFTQTTPGLPVPLPGGDFRWPDEPPPQKPDDDVDSLSSFIIT